MISTLTRLVGRIMSKSNTSTFNRATDSLEAIRDFLSMNSGLVFYGVVTDVPGANQFTLTELIGQGAGKFADATNPWSAYVFRDAGGLGAVPQGEIQLITAYNTLTGDFTTIAFTAAVAVNDEILIVHPSIAGGVSSLDSVYFDEVLGSAGTTMPVGTPETPVNNLADALTILGARNLSKLVLAGSGVHALTLTTGFNYQIVGNRAYTITIAAGANVNINGDLECLELANTTGAVTVAGKFTGWRINNTGTGSITVDGYTKVDVVINSGLGTVTLQGGSEVDGGWDNTGGGSIGVLRGIKIVGALTMDGVANAIIYGDSQINQILHGSTGNIGVFGRLHVPSTVDLSAAGTLHAYGETEIIGAVTVAAGAVITLHAKSRIYGAITGAGTVNYWTEFGDTVYFDDSDGAAGTTFPIGTADHPCSVAADVRTICLRENIKKIHVNGTFTVPATMETYEFDGNPARDVIDFNGQDVDASSFNGLRFTGAQGGTGSIFAENCILVDATGLAGVFKDCGLDNPTFADRITQLVNSYNCTVAEIAVNYAGVVRIYGWSGGPLKITDVDDAGTVLNITVQDGSPVEIDATCTAGTINIYGSANVTDNSVGATVNDYTLETTVNDIATLTSSEGELTADGTEQDVVLENAPAGNFKPLELKIDTTNMQAGDTTIIRVYERVESGGAFLLENEVTYSDVQAIPLKTFDFGPNLYGFEVTLEQTAGVNRNYLWQFFDEEIV